MPISTSGFYNNRDDERITVPVDVSFFQTLMQNLNRDSLWNREDRHYTMNQEETEDPFETDEENQYVMRI